MHVHVVAAATAWERRVALTPDAVSRLAASGHRVTVDPGAGAGSGFSDDEYAAAGASIGRDGDADLMVAVERPEPASISGARSLLGLLDPLGDRDGIVSLAATGATLLAFELVPRSTRAQAVDVLSSQSSLAGYQAALEAATLCDRIFPMLTTAAGTIRPARVLVLGAGVAGLQAIATARRLGAQVFGFDVRAAAAEQVESLGAKFVDTGVRAEGEGGYARELTDEERQQQQDVLAKHVALADAVITTAAVPGRPAPKLITRAMLENMKHGAVIVDLAAETGGNCELTHAGETVTHGAVRIIGPVNLPSR